MMTFISSLGDYIIKLNPFSSVHSQVNSFFSFDSSNDTHLRLFFLFLWEPIMLTYLIKSKQYIVSEHMFRYNVPAVELHRVSVSGVGCRGRRAKIDPSPRGACALGRAKWSLKRHA